MKIIGALYGESTVTLLTDTLPKIISAGAVNFSRIRKAAMNGDYAIIPALLDVQESVKILTLNNITYDGKVAYFGGKPLNGVVSQKLLSMLAQGVESGSPLLAFLDNMVLNPSAESANQLFDFMSYKELPLTQDGLVLAYKGVQDSYYSVHGNTKTIVLKGKVDAGGHILNEVGAEIEVARLSVDSDRYNHCSHGLHCGSFDYANSWGARTLVVRVNPRDAVAVPTDCSYQKMRVSAYTVLSEIPRQSAAPIDKAVVAVGTFGEGKKLSKDELRAEMDVVIQREETDLFSDVEVESIKAHLSTQNFKSLDFLSIVEELRKAKTEAAKALKVKGLRYVKNAIQRGVAPTLKGIQSSLKTNGLSQDTIRGWFKNGAYFVNGDAVYPRN